MNECRLRMRYCQCGPWFEGECPYRIPAERQTPERKEVTDDTNAANDGGQTIETIKQPPILAEEHHLGSQPSWEVPFGQERFKALIGLDSDGMEIRMRPAISDRGCIDGREGHPDMTDPAVYMARWLVDNWDSLRNMAARAYNQNIEAESAKRNLRYLSAQAKAEAEERARPEGTGKLIAIDGGLLEGK